MENEETNTVQATVEGQTVDVHYLGNNQYDVTLNGVVIVSKCTGLDNALGHAAAVIRRHTITVA